MLRRSGDGVLRMGCLGTEVLRMGCLGAGVLRSEGT
jgi:hypothetical protein